MRKPWLQFAFLIWVICQPSPLLAQANPWQIAMMALQIPSGGQPLLSFLQHSAKRGTSSHFVAEVLRESKDLQDRDLPPQGYLLKADEGLAKGVPPDAMQAALLQTSRQSRVAGQWVDRAVARGWIPDRPQDRRSMAERYRWALVNGVSPGKLARITLADPPGNKPGNNLNFLEKSLQGLMKSTDRGLVPGPDEDWGGPPGVEKPGKYRSKKWKKQKKDKWLHPKGPPGTSQKPPKGSKKGSFHPGKGKGKKSKGM